MNITAESVMAGRHAAAGAALYIIITEPRTLGPTSVVFVLLVALLYGALASFAAWLGDYHANRKHADIDELVEKQLDAKALRQLDGAQRAANIRAGR
jgi:hypothetical protein